MILIILLFTDNRPGITRNGPRIVLLMTPAVNFGP